MGDVNFFTGKGLSNIDHQQKKMGGISGYACSFNGRTLWSYGHPTY